MKYKITILCAIISILIAFAIMVFLKPVFILPIDSFTGSQQLLFGSSGNRDEGMNGDLHYTCKNKVNAFLVMKDDSLCCRLEKTGFNQLNINVTFNLFEQESLKEAKTAVDLNQETCFKISFSGQGKISAIAFVSESTTGPGNGPYGPFDIARFNSHSKWEIEQYNKNIFYGVITLVLLTIAIFSGITSFFNLFLREKNLYENRRNMKERKSNRRRENE